MKQTVKKLKLLLAKNKDIIDIILFGSFVKGKGNASDIDIAVLSEVSIDRLKMKKELEVLLGKKIDLQIVTLHDYSKSIWIALIREGFSVKHDVFLHQLYKIEPLVLYKYSLKELTASKKVMFERALKNFAGIQRISNRVILVPIGKSEEFNDFLKIWNIDFDAREYGLLPLMRKEEG
ncbi:nucleotidyltransferase domain-containing protein [Candidatus Woesearchaeota archaeon]|nr:nucleotidyltransferase domain-containing protein [Candidatus Woesearchaeota archaeon]